VGLVNADDTASVDRVLSTTRAVRRRLDLQRVVDPDVVTECLRLAVQAPTGGNAQGWRWLIVTDQATRSRLADLYRAGDGGRFRRRAQRLRDSDPQTSRVYSSAEYLSEILHRVPVHVVPCMQGRVTTSSTVEAASFYGSILPAVWSFMLALRARGLGSVWTTLHLAHEREAAELLGIPDDYTQVALVPVAYTVGTEFRPASRAPVESTTFWNHWGNATRA
jgi:nitroreductase